MYQQILPLREVEQNAQ